MFLLKSVIYHAAATETIRRDVKCEKCGVAFEYHMVRRGDASHMRGGYSQQSAEVAKSAAIKALKKRLVGDIDPVRCPDCNWLQSEMVEEARKRRHRWMTKAGWAAAILAILDLGFAFLGERGSPFIAGNWEMLWWFVGLPTVIAIVAFVLRRGLCRAYDPNLTNEIFPDSPPAMKNGVICNSARREAAVQERTLNYERRAAELSPGGWIAVQLLTAHSPAICCECQNPTGRCYYLRPAKVGFLKLHLCADCNRRFIGRASLCIISTILTIFGAISYLLIHFGSDNVTTAGKLITAGFLAIVMGSALGWILSRVFTTPARLRRFSRERNTAQLRFRNPAFTHTYVDANAI